LRTGRVFAPGEREKRTPRDVENSKNEARAGSPVETKSITPLV
jgi:hypothetical protein